MKILFRIHLLLCFLVSGFSHSLWGQCSTSSFGTSDCSTFTMDISSFTFASTTHNSAGCDNTSTGRTYFPSPVFNVTQGQNYSFTINSNAALTYYAAIWIDYNNNGQFESAENVWNSGSTSNLSFTGNITIPGTTVVGTVRMRVRTSGETVMTGSDACTSYISVLFNPLPAFGETHDYDVLIAGSTSTVDMSATSLVTPTSPMCGGNSNVVVQIRNQSASTINFATNNVTVNSSVSGPNPQTFPAVILSSGTLASNATQNVTVATGYNMTAAGSYVFNASTSVTGDVNTSNDAMTAASVTVNVAPTATLSGSSTICPSGSAQLTFTLTGSNPWSLTYTDGVTPVTLTGITASPHVVSVSPTATRTYTLTAASNTNCPASSATGTHVVTVRPAATALLSGTATICPAGAATLTVTFTGTSPYSYTYTDGTTPVTLTGITTSPFLITVTPGSNRTYTGTALSDFCGASSGFSGSATITISASSTATLSGNVTFCAGSATNLNVALTGAAPWSITFSDGTSTLTRTGINSSPYSLSVTPSANTTYTLTGVTNPCGSGTASGTATANQISPPTASLSGGEVICSGNGSQLTATFTGNSPWVLGYSNGTTTTQVTANSSPYLFSVSPTVNTTYTAVSVSMPGCSSGSASGSAVITIGSTAIASMSGGATVCSGQGTSLSVTLSGGAPYSFVYSNGVANIQVSGITASPYVLPVTPGTTTTYSLVSMNSTGCGSGPVSGSSIVTVTPAPVAILSGGAAICQSGTAILTVTLSGNAPWSFSYTDGTNVSQVTGVNNSPYLLSVSPVATPSVFTLTQVSDNLCSTGPFTGSATVIIGTPTTGTLTGPASICPGNQASLSVNLSGGTHPPYSITYTHGTTPVTITGITSNPYVWNQSMGATTTFTLLTTSNSICSGGIAPSQIVVGLTPPVSASFTATVSNDTVTTSNTSANATSYVWNFGSNGNWVSGTNPLFVYSGGGNYTITLVAVGPCGTDTARQNVTIVAPVSVEDEFGASGDWAIFPNPNTGSFELLLPEAIRGAQSVQVQILDVSGRTLVRREYTGGLIQTDLTRGVYLLRVESDGKQYQKKIVVR